MTAKARYGSLIEGELRASAPVVKKPVNVSAKRKLVTKRNLDAALEIVGKFVARHVRKLEARIVDLEARQTPSYKGTWKRGQEYRLGDMVMRGGSVWHSDIYHNTNVPGSGEHGWTLAVKRGRDARDDARRSDG
jgi:hypothetical protein